MKLHVIGRAGGGVSRRFLEESLAFIAERLPPLKPPPCYAPGSKEADRRRPLSGRSVRRKNPSSFPPPPMGIKKRSEKSGGVLSKRLFSPPLVKKSRPFRQPELSLTVAFLSEKAARDLNFRFRGKNKPTDVLSFAPLEEDSFGEIALYCDPKRAARLKLTVKEEIFYLFLHGILHLSGFRHDKEPEASCMFALQDQIFEQWLSAETAAGPSRPSGKPRSPP